MIHRAVFVVAFSMLSCCTAHAISVDLNNLAFTPPDDPINVVTIDIMTDTLGDDSDTSEVSGFISATIDFDFFGADAQPTAIELTGGDVRFSDTEFSFLFGLVSATSTGIRGVPDTPLPPSLVTAGAFAASDHTILLGEGMIEAGGETIDLSVDPILVVGVGTGQVSLTSNGPGIGNDYSFNATIVLPIEFNQEFMLTDVPVVDTVNGTFSGQGTIVASQDFTLTIPTGDYNFDGTLDCIDLMMLEQSIDNGSTDTTFDANGDGFINADDELFWLSDLRAALPGDANLDDLVNGADFLVWNVNKFASGKSWCDGDWNHDGLTDGQDFLIWNINKFTGVSGSVSAVPEPKAAWCLWGVWSIGVLLASRKRTAK